MPCDAEKQPRLKDQAKAELHYRLHGYSPARSPQASLLQWCPVLGRGLHTRLCLGPAAEANQCADRDSQALGAELTDITLKIATQPGHRKLPAVTLLLGTLLLWQLYFIKFPSPFFQCILTVRRG